MTKVGVLGAGIAGLMAALTLKNSGFNVRVFEKEKHAGGVIRTTHHAGFLVEHGPATIRASTPLVEEVLEHLGLTQHVVEASDKAQRRYIVRNNALVPVPGSPIGLLTTDMFSLRGKLRVLCEPFFAPADPAEPESVAAFIERHFGQEALSYGADPFLTGIYAGDPHRLSADHVLSSLRKMQRSHGSVLRGFLKGNQKDNAPMSHTPRYRIFSFREGIQQLPNAVTNYLGDMLHLDTEVTSIAKSGQRWVITTSENGSRREYQVDAVVAALPLPAWKQIEGSLQTDIAPLTSVEYPPIATLTLGFQEEDVGHLLDGFGVLIPSIESRFSMLGVIFSSSIFPHQAPEGHVLLSARIGGMRRPDLARAGMVELARLATSDLKDLLEIRGDPVFVHHTYWQHAIPQYEVGYDRVQAHLSWLERQYPGLVFAGNYRNGISLTDAMQSGYEAALKLSHG